MKKSHKILIPVFSVLLVAAIAAVYFTLNGTIKRKPDLSGDVENGVYKSAEFSQLDSYSLKTGYPLVQSDIDSLYYCVSPDGNVKYYEYNAGKISEFNGVVKQLQVNVELSYNKIPITLYYIEKDGKTTGYGLFTNADTNNNVNLYSYVFAHITDSPVLYGLKGKMLLLNTNPEEAYNSDKTYTEIFDVNMTDGTCSNVFSQRDRTVDKSGKMTERWNILTDSFIKSVGQKASVISGRLYDSDTDTYDVFDMNKSINKPDALGMYGTFLRDNKDGSYIFLKKTAKGFKSVKYISQEEDIVSFEGDIKKDFVFSGNWVYSVKERTFTNLIDGKKIISESTEAIDMFTVNSDGSKIVAVANYENQAFFVINSDGTTKGYSGENIFNSNIKNICFADDNTVLVTSVSDSECVNRLIKVS